MLSCTVIYLHSNISKADKTECWQKVRWQKIKEQKVTWRAKNVTEKNHKLLKSFIWDWKKLLVYAKVFAFAVLKVFGICDVLELLKVKCWKEDD